MILIQYSLAKGEGPNEELEDNVEAFMGDMDYAMCGSGSVSSEVRTLEFEGEDNDHELELINNPMLLEMLQEQAGAKLDISHSPADE